MMDLAEIILRGAHQRTETRGSHFRTDFPTRDDANWLKHTLAMPTDKGTVFLLPDRGRRQVQAPGTEILRREPP